MANLLQQLRGRVGRSLAYGRQPTPLPRPYQEMGVAGTAVWGGYVQVKERSPEWIGWQKWITASDLAVNTSIVAAGVHYFLNLVAYPKWTIRPADDKDEESLALAEFVDHVINHMDSPWYKVVRRAAMYRFHGFGIQEWTAKHREDGLIGFKDIEARPQHTIEQWDVDLDGTVLGVWQRSPQTGHMLGIPRDKTLYLVEDTLTDSPEGIGMLRHAADPYKRLKQLQELEIRAYERDLRGIPIARAPLTFINRAIKQGQLTQEEANTIINDMKSMVQLQVKQSDTGLVMDSLPYFSDSDAGDQVSGVPQWGFELLSGSGVGHAEIAAAIDRVQREIARIMGVEHLMMGDIGGNRSLAEDKSRNLYLIANSVLKYVASTVKSDIVVPLFKLNGFPMDKLPNVETEDVTFKNADAITGALQRMASAGAPLTAQDPVVNDIRELLGVSRVPDDIMAQGAMPQNPMLAGIPPQLQLGPDGKPVAPGTPGEAADPDVTIGPKGGAGQPRFPGQGGGKNPFAKRPFFEQEPEKIAPEQVQELPVDENGNPVQEPTQPTRNGMLPTGVKPLRGKPNGRLPNGTGAINEAQGDSLPGQPLEGQAAQAAQGTPQEADVGREPVDPKQQLAKPGEEAPGIDIKGSGKVEVDSGLLVRLLERFAGPPAVQQAAAEESGATGKPTDKPAVGEGLPPQAEPGSDAAVAAPGGAKPLPEGTEGKPVPGKGPPGALGQPVGDATAAQAKPGAPGQPKPGTPAVDPKTGQPLDPTEEPPGAPGGPGAYGKPLLGPDGKPLLGPDGQPLPPGMPPPPKEEMDIEQAVEILQPYAGGPPNATGLDQSESRTESDDLYERLGQEKDVQAAVTDQSAQDVLADKERVARGGEPMAATEGSEGSENAPLDPDAATGVKPPQGAGEQPVRDKPGSAAPAGIKPNPFAAKPNPFAAKPNGKPKPNGKVPLPVKPGVVEPGPRKKPVPTKRVRL